MEIRSFSDSIKKALTATMIAGTVLSFSSCDRLHEDLQPCPQGVRLRFVYNYNMEFANAFPSQVDCLTVLFYDSDGNYVTTKTNMTASDLSDENWRMTVDLAPGNYSIIAYGGMECTESSFSFTAQPSTIRMDQLQVELNPECLTDPDERHLHDLFYGNLEVTVEQSDTEYKDYTLYMMKDTNNLRVLLQQVDGTPIDEADFDFKVVDDNTLMAWNNAVVKTRSVDYLTWARGNESPGELPDNGKEATVAWAEMSFPRLVTTNSPRLVITRKEDGHNVVDIPLNNYLLLMKGQTYANMPDQEFLDRKSRWNLFFFLRGGTWLSVEIVVDDWTVRINNTEF
ncbi:MAG: FimB/Mfa2 family fimbrial subunit [Muribaculaceae bacterium]|nr:FimB/Mfa2 family fimbrial subunit [Muribaculaceae bacterium]